MISLSDYKGQATETQEDAVRTLSDAPCLDDNDRLSRTCMLCTEDEKLITDSMISNNTLKEPCCSVDDQDYVEKIEKFLFYVDMVKETAKPGCSPEMLNVALSSMASLVKTLSVISSKHYIQSSL